MNPELLQSYVILVLAGLLLIGAEIYVPGGVLGVIGGLCLLGAVVLGFQAFPGAGGLYSGFAIILVSGLVLVLWVNFFPRTAAGKRLMLLRDGRANKASDQQALKPLIGHTGTASSALRPSGIAVIDGQRKDVIAEGVWIKPGAAIRVVGVEGGHIVVRAVAPPAAAKDAPA